MYFFNLNDFEDESATAKNWLSLKTQVKWDWQFGNYDRLLNDIYLSYLNFTYLHVFEIKVIKGSL